MKFIKYHVTTGPNRDRTKENDIIILFALIINVLGIPY